MRYVYLLVCSLIFIQGCSNHTKLNQQFSANNHLSKRNLMNKYPNYLFFNFDINQDGLKDYIITSNPNNSDTGFDDLYVYLSLDGKKYQFLTHGTNFNEDGGNKFSSIIPRSNNQGFIISTAFPDRGYLFADYYISPSSQNNHQWILQKVVNKGYFSGYIDNQFYEDEFYYCTHYQNKNPIFSKNTTLTIKSYSDKEMIKICSIPTTYVIKSEKLEILDDKFKKLNTNSHFAKGDTINAVDQTDDWIRVVYNNGEKAGWVNKKDLTPK